MADEPEGDIFERLERSASRDGSEEDKRRLTEELIERAAKAKIGTSIVEYGRSETAIEVKVPQGRESRAIYLYGVDDLKRILRIPFEKYRFVEGLAALCNYEDGSVEAGIRMGRQGIAAPTSRILPRVMALGDGGEGPSPTEIKLESLGPGKPSLSLGPPTPAYKAFMFRRSSEWTIKLILQGLSTHDQARQLLTSYSNSLFFQIDFLYGVPLALVRERPRFRRPIRSRLSGTNIVQYPTTAYDEAPSSLYWYGRSADGMPLLQFLAFYQVVEYFFPVYAQAEAQRRVRLILKDPTFRADRDTDIGRIVSTIKAARSGAFFDERTQLRATLKECVSPDQLRSFIEEDERRLKFYKDDYKSVHNIKIPVANPTADLRDEVADRLYGIRCKIVHTKHSEFGEAEIELLLPYSKEEENLTFDIELMAFIAKSAIIASGTSL